MTGRSSGGLPELGEGAWTRTNDPSDEDVLKGVEDLTSEAGSEPLYQHEQGRDKLVHDTGLLPGGCMMVWESSPYLDRSRWPVFIRSDRLRE
jgi:hypothetical protein